jgi:hypothetical protein
VAGFVHIFVEGDADVKFLSDYIGHIVPNVTVKIIKDKDNRIKEASVNRDENVIATIHSLSGWTDLANMGTPISQYKDSGDCVFVVFDADTSENEGGFTKRKEQIENYALPLDGIFLFPNNKDDGALEDLLENIINPSNQPIFDCWSKYETCLHECASQKIGKELSTPAKKSKIYSYLEVLLGKTEKERKKIGDANRDFTNAEHWNLDSAFLEPLKQFLLEKLK